MEEEWIIRVGGRDYGPADLELLREWKAEGRVVPANPARLADAEVWVTAGEIPGLFESTGPTSLSGTVPTSQAAPTHSIWKGTWAVYRKGFVQFTCLAMLVVVPSVCAQLTSAALESSSEANVDFRALLATGFAFCMLLLNLVLWPVYIGGIQLLSAELIAGRRPGFFALLNSALKFWPRIALLCLLVYGSYFFWTVVPVGLIFVLLLSSPSIFSVFLALLLLGFWVWIVGRLWVNFLFWQQLSVLAGTDVAETLQRSKQLARSASDLPWYRRPLWRGVFIFSIWGLFVLALSIGPAWPMIREYFHQMSNSQNPEALMQALKASSKAHRFDALSFAFGIFQGLVRPLLGIAFVFLYLDASGSSQAR